MQYLRLLGILFLVLLTPLFGQSGPSSAYNIQPSVNAPANYNLLLGDSPVMVVLDDVGMGKATADTRLENLKKGYHRLVLSSPSIFTTVYGFEATEGGEFTLVTDPKPFDPAGFNTILEQYLADKKAGIGMKRSTGCYIGSFFLGGPFGIGLWYLIDQSKRAPHKKLFQEKIQVAYFNLIRLRVKDPTCLDGLLKNPSESQLQKSGIYRKDENGRSYIEPLKVGRIKGGYPSMYRLYNGWYKPSGWVKVSGLKNGKLRVQHAYEVGEEKTLVAFGTVEKDVPFSIINTMKKVGVGIGCVWLDSTLKINQIQFSFNLERPLNGYFGIRSKTTFLSGQSTNSGNQDTARYKIVSEGFQFKYNPKLTWLSISCGPSLTYYTGSSTWGAKSYSGTEMGVGIIATLGVDLFPLQIYGVRLEYSMGVKLKSISQSGKYITAPFNHNTLELIYHFKWY